jgi:hypothetical protein
VEMRVVDMFLSPVLFCLFKARKGVVPCGGGSKRIDSVTVIGFSYERGWIGEGAHLYPSPRA